MPPPGQCPRLHRPLFDALGPTYPQPLMMSVLRERGPVTMREPGETAEAGTTLRDRAESMPPQGPSPPGPTLGEFIEFRRRLRAVTGLIGDCLSTLDNDRRSIR